jgi:MFS family permease
MKSTAALKSDPVIFIAAVFFVRIFSLFSFIPLLNAFSVLRDNALTPWVLGSYPFFHALGQVPFGIASDRFGRMTVIRYGLILFALATLMCLFASDIYTLLIARSIQGFCALGAPAQALLADLSQSSNQLQSRYYLIGAFIVLGLICGFIAAFAAQAWNFPGLIFILTLICIVLLIIQSYFLPQTTKTSAPSRSDSPVSLEYSMIFLANSVLHFLQSFTLGAVHYVMSDTALGSPSALMGACLLAALFLCAQPLRRRDYNYSLDFSSVLSWGLLLPYLGIFVIPGHESFLIILILVLVFSLLLLLEATLPAALKRQAYSTGFTMGLYNTFQYGSMSMGSVVIAYGGTLSQFLCISALASLPLSGALMTLRKISQIDSKKAYARDFVADSLVH